MLEIHGSLQTIWKSRHDPSFTETWCALEMFSSRRGERHVPLREETHLADTCNEFFTWTEGQDRREEERVTYVRMNIYRQDPLRWIFARLREPFSSSRRLLFLSVSFCTMAGLASAQHQCLDTFYHRLALRALKSRDLARGNPKHRDLLFVWRNALSGGPPLNRL